MKKHLVLIIATCLSIFYSCSKDKAQDSVLKFGDYAYYFVAFNKNDNELYKQYIPNDSVLPFLEKNIPLLDIPDSSIQKTYYFRWWTFRKHIKQIPNGFVITEFLPDVPWAGKYNTINCPASYHIYEGRWLRDDTYIKSYIDYWLSEADNVRKYSFWAADATLAFGKVDGDTAFLKKWYSKLIQNYYGWETEHRDATDRLFWQSDNYDGMEFSAGGRVLNGGVVHGSTTAARPTINSYMYGDAKAISQIASYFGDVDTSQEFDKKAENIKELLDNRLWNDSLNFYTIIPRDYNDNSKPIDIRELIGYTPWYFNLPDDDPKYVKAWEKVLDTTAFAAPYGLTTTERSHPYFQIRYEGHECQWNGPSWPFATTQALKSFSNFLNNYKYNGNLSKDDYFNLLKQYAEAHKITWENRKSQMWIDENINPFTGDWISRTRLKTWDNGTWSKEKGGVERGKDYNHSGFCDLVINDLIGLKPQLGNSIVLEPLVPDSWEWFCLDKINYHGKDLTLIWDKDGTRYKRGNGFTIVYNGKKVYNSPTLKKIHIPL